jgi:hypothetical protein
MLIAVAFVVVLVLVAGQLGAVGPVELAVIGLLGLIVAMMLRRRRASV